MPILLKELFNKIYPYKQTGSSNSVTLYEFNTESNENYVVQLRRQTLWELSLKDYQYEDIEMDTGYTKNDIAVTVIFTKKDKYGIYTLDITPSANFSSVFATVFKIMRDNIKNNEPIAFSAKENSRVKLYDSFIQKYKRTTDILLKLNVGMEKFYLLLHKKN